VNVLSGWLDRILGRSRADAGGAQRTTAEVREGDGQTDAPASTGDLEEGAHAARDETIASDAPAQPPGAG
jgi:hypothetical protein